MLQNEIKILRKRIYACVLGNILEWYDFILFGAFASTISQVFFPEDNPQIGLLKTYGIFATGFIMRPLGSVVLGMLGDQYGRRPALLSSLLLMAIPTFFIGLLPPYEMIGAYGPLLLIFLRLIQGFALGGEYSGSMVFLFEHAPHQRKALYSSWVDCGCLIGVLCGTLAAWATSTFSQSENYLIWGWRIPFLMSFIFAVFAFYFRKNFEETPSFLVNKNKNRSLKFWPSPFKLLAAILVYAFGNVGFYILLVFLPNFFIEKTILTIGEATLITSVLSALMAVCIPFAGYFSDVIGRKKLLFFSIILTSIISIPLFKAAFYLHFPSFLFFQVLFALGLSIFYGGEAAFLSEIFPIKFRFTAVSLSLSCANLLFGGCAPLVAEWLTQYTQDINNIAVGIILIGIGAATTLYKLANYSRNPSLDESTEPLQLGTQSTAKFL